MICANCFIHRGWSAGSAGCIDLWKNNNSFFKILLEQVEQHKENILKNEGKIPLNVMYQDSTKVECDDYVYTKQCKPEGENI